ncbi:phosphoglycerate dehydrogenase [Gracilibacillus sp. YIM 98692]|uniref:phosphoglycerate dehydrogenase n=1 Tax=Gracilibacillus sp. YIM 98692 TaxID=2663532 RepID=UPI0013D20A89|nr:phosphoglycerate dehydrogenase [Gracilibacillus sp. YIM 98692]
MSYKVLVTPRSFGKHSQEPIDLLKEKGLDIIHNPYGRIMTKDEMIEQVKDIDGVIVGVDPLDADVLKHAQKLKVISKYGVGTDNIDVDFAKQNNIPVTVTQNANADAVADYALALMLSSARKVVHIDQECRHLNWNKITTVDMHKKTLGLVGLGNIGKKVARRAQGFDMKVLAYDLFHDKAYAEESGVEYVDTVDKIFSQADFISLHLPLNEHTQHLVGAKQFEMMKSTAVIINTARGGLIDEKALFHALNEKQIWGAGIDVFEQEPPSNTELLSLNNLVIGSHCAASTVQAVDNMGIMASQNLINALSK